MSEIIGGRLILTDNERENLTRGLFFPDPEVLSCRNRYLSSLSYLNPTQNSDGSIDVEFPDLSIPIILHTTVGKEDDILLDDTDLLHVISDKTTKFNVQYIYDLNDITYIQQTDNFDLNFNEICAA